MNSLTTQQRRLVYLVGIALLMVPIIWLGAPRGANDAGGMLAKLRSENDLGEANLGNVDPSSETMNLVLVGLRGIAVNQLWMQANKNQETKNWEKLRSNINSIILLQPHYVKVWEYQGWNLAYNVSSEWDLVQDKYYWIKEGAKFSIDGTKRNKNESELYWWVGIILGDKISRHDAWEYMRKFFNPSAYPENYASGTADPFRGDPDIRKETGEIKPDPNLNPDNKDNYLVAKEWFHKANDMDKIKAQRRMASVAFRQRPARSQMAYAEMMQKEGRYNEKDLILMQNAWKIGYREWTTQYLNPDRPGFGQELYNSQVGYIRLQAENDKEIEELIQEDKDAGITKVFTVKQKRYAIDGERKIVNYNYWRTRAEIETKSEMLEAHRDIYFGKVDMKQGRIEEASRKLLKGLNTYAGLLDRHPDLKTQDESVEEVMIAILAWQELQLRLFSQANIRNTPPPTKPSLETFWNAHSGNRDHYHKLLLRELADIQQKLGER